ncbi:hypothetical protein Trydic_g14820 [Trypoxylus dichotomus]
MRGIEQARAGAINVNQICDRDKNYQIRINQLITRPTSIVFLKSINQLHTSFPSNQKKTVDLMKLIRAHRGARHSPSSNLMEHAWDVLGVPVTARNVPPRTPRKLQIAAREE